MKKTWLIAPNVGQSLLKEFPDLPPVILQLLSNRGFNKKQEIEEFFNSNFQEHVHDPFLFRDMEKAVARIFESIEKQEKIVIFGDFDADGVTSTAVVASVLAAFGAKFDYYIPHREIEGYGLNTESIQTMKN
ncbi:MAG TPA: single-stranded-DNA-specific exonuclease RecJ, partial [bacterium]|nr:single-stranded-DNA-specific exonuclease RecJ [bacterium]